MEEFADDAIMKKMNELNGGESSDEDLSMSMDGEDVDLGEEGEAEMDESEQELSGED